MGSWKDGDSNCVLNSNAQKSVNKKNKKNITTHSSNLTHHALKTLIT